MRAHDARRAAPLAFWWFALAAACGSAGDGQQPGAEGEADAEGEAESEGAMPPLVEVGRGEPGSTLFQSLPDDGSFPLVEGPQGGYHVFVQVRATGLGWRRVVCERRLVEPVSGIELRRQSDTLGMVDVGDGVLGFPTALLTFVCPSLLAGQAAYDVPLRLDVLLEDESGATAEARAPLVPRCPAGDSGCRQGSVIGCAAP